MQLMQHEVQKSTTTTRPRSSLSVGAREAFNQPRARANPGGVVREAIGGRSTRLRCTLALVDVVAGTCAADRCLTNRAPTPHPPARAATTRANFTDPPKAG